MSQTAFDFTLNTRDHDVLRTLKTLCKSEGRNTFSADDIFLLQLDRFFSDKQHEIGSWFARLQHHKKIEAVGYVRSKRVTNHMRQVRVYAFVEKEGGIQK